MCQVTGQQAKCDAMKVTRQHPGPSVRSMVRSLVFQKVAGSLGHTPSAMAEGPGRPLVNCGEGWAHALKPKGRSHRTKTKPPTAVHVEAVNEQFERYYSGLIPSSEFEAFMVLGRLKNAPSPEIDPDACSSDRRCSARHFRLR